MTGQAGHRAALERMERARALTVHQIEEISRQIVKAAELQGAQAAPARWQGREGEWSPTREPAYWAALARIVARRGNELVALWRRRERQDRALRTFRRKHWPYRPSSPATPFAECRP